MSLKFIALSGTVSVTENLYVYEADGQMMVVDCGVGFPDLEMPGVDLVIPDFSYIVKNKDRLAGILISQGHEDHIGALPYLLKEVSTAIWAAPLVTGFIKDKLDEFGIKNSRINTFDFDSESFSIGPFIIHPFSVTHSVPDTCGFAIDTPEGRIFHVPEHKITQDQVVGKSFDTKRAEFLSSEKKVLFLASDCLGSNKPGFTAGEGEIEKNMEGIMKDAKQAIFVTTISSNIGRFQQILNIAQRLNRKVVLVGRSVQKKIEISSQLGYLKYPRDLVISYKEAEKLNQNKLVYIIAGCYGQVGSSLYRVALNDHEMVHIQKDDMVIFSADPAPPYTKESEDFVIDNLIDKGADVHYYDLNEGLDDGLYTSGHGGKEDIKELFRIVNPRYFIPIGGEIRYMKSYMDLAVKFGANPNNIFRLKPGESVIFENGNAKKGPTVPTKKVLVHGLGIGDIGRVVLQDRTILGSEGFVVALLKLNKRKKLQGEPEIFTRGFVFEKIEKSLLNKAKNKLKLQIEKNGISDKKSIERRVKIYLENFFFQKTGRHPMILPIIVEI